MAWYTLTTAAVDADSPYASREVGRVYGDVRVRGLGLWRPTPEELLAELARLEAALREVR